MTEDSRDDDAPPSVAVATVTVATTALIRASKERVWGLLTDFSRMHRWFFGVRAVRLDGPPGVGAHRLVTFAGGLTQRETISAWAPPGHLALIVAQPSGLIGAGTQVNIRLAPAADGVCLDWSIALRLNLGRLLALLGPPLLRPLVGGALRKSVARLRRIAESSPGT